MKFTALILIFVVIVAGTSSHAQYYFYDDKYYDKPLVFEIGGSAGGMNCFTDLGGKKGAGKQFIKDYNPGNTQFCASLFFNATWQDAIALKLEGTYGQVEAYDSILKKAGPSTFGRYERNLSFRSLIAEFTASLEVHPLYLLGSHDENWKSPSISPYILAGIGLYEFNPQALFSNAWVDLHPLHTEGQGFSQYPERKDYKLTGLNIPVGIGFKYELSPLLNVRGEFVYRILKTDYLDDVSTSYIDPNDFRNNLSGTLLNQALLLNKRSTNTAIWKTDPGSQRGNPKNNDAYFTFNLKLGLVLGRERIKR